MIDHTNSQIEKLAVHSVGNKTNGEELHLSNSLLNIADEKVKELLYQFFLQPFSTPEYYSFTFTNEDFNLNAVYNFASQIFDKPGSLHKQSVHLAKHLYELSVHPQIKSGDLLVAYFTDITVEDEICDAVGIFKSENRQSFLKLETGGDDFFIEPQDGINTEKLDKGCLIFNTDRDTGFKVCIVDKANKANEAQYWKDNFLQLKPCSDNYHHTQAFLNITKNFVTKQLDQDFEVSKADKIDYLNRSVEYFKSNESFDKGDFERKVFQEPGIINSFRKFDAGYREENEIEPADNFDISAQAVKKQARVFKSVLKLDKNFHIYIHGDRQLIEQGIETDGRKYYKIYFRQES